MAQLCTDYENDYAQVNQQLEKMGYNIGVRLIEDFLAKTSMARCGNFRDTAEMISKVCALDGWQWPCSPRFRLASRSFSISLLPSPTGLQTTSHSHSSSMKIPWQILSSYRMMAALRTSFGSLISSAVYCEEHSRWSVASTILLLDTYLIRNRYRCR